MARTDRSIRSGPERSFDELLECAKCGDGRAFKELYDRLHRRVHAFARTRGCEDPEGLVNDVFVAVFGAIGSFTGGEEQFKAWVFRIARNKIIDEFRRRSRLPDLIDLDDGVVHGIAGIETAEGLALSRIGLESLLLTLSALTDDQREVLLLRTVGDLSLESVAEIIDRRTGAVKALQHRAVRTLRRLLSDEAEVGRIPECPLHVVEG